MLNNCNLYHFLRSVYKYTFFSDYCQYVLYKNRLPWFKQSSLFL